MLLAKQYVDEDVICISAPPILHILDKKQSHASQLSMAHKIPSRHLTSHVGGVDFVSQRAPRDFQSVDHRLARNFADFLFS
jgi:hypothetical protein